MALLALLGSLFFLVPREMESYLTGELERRGTTVARKVTRG
jgi:hypothetical protein